MPPIILTDAEFALIKRVSGGFNYNFAQDSTLDADGRFKAKGLPANMNALNLLVERFEPHDVPAPPPTPPDAKLTDLGTLGIGATPWGMVQPGEVMYFRAGADGQVSCAASSGGFYCWGNVNPNSPGSFPADASVTQAGAGTAARLPIKVGQYYSYKHDSPSEQRMHASIEG